MKLRHIIAAAFAVGTALAAPAQAGVLSAADLTIRSLFLVDTKNNNAPVTSGIAINSDSRTGTATADFNGVPAVGVGSNSITSTTPGATVDVQHRCRGVTAACTAPIGENDTLTHLLVPAGNFSFSDMFLAGSAIDASGANGLTRADASVMNATNIGGANSTILNGVTATTSFTAGADMTLAFGLTYDAFVHVFMDALTPSMTGAASAKYSWDLSLVDSGTGARVVRWSPDDLNQGFSISSPNNLTFASTNGGLPIFSNSFVAQSGHTYSLTINQASNALASLNAVPEPGSVMLVGLGLAALGASVRRRRAR